MEKYAAFVVSHSRWVVLAVVLLTIALGSQARFVHFDLRRRSQLPQGHPYVQVQNTIADKFGGDTTLVIGVVAHDGDVFTPAILEKIRRITIRLEETPGVISNNLLSIASERVKAIRASGDGIDARPFLGEVPYGRKELKNLKSEVLGDGIYGRLLASRDGGTAGIVVDFDDQLSDAEIYATIDGILTPEREDHLVQFALAGSPVVRVAIVEYTRSMIFLFPIAVLIIGIMHYQAFRTMQAMLLPLLTALLSVTWALGVMGIVRAPMDTWSAITPVVILAVAAGHAVQILKRYYEEYGRLGDNELAIVRSLRSIGPVTIIAGAIAAAGFASLMTFGVSSVRVFGLLLASGILSALVIEMTFIPACRALLRSPRKLEVDREREGPIVRGMLDGLAGQSLDRPYLVLAVALVLTAGAFVGISRLHVDNSLRAWFPTDSPLLRDDRLINEELAGTSTLYIYLEGDQEGALENPDVLHAVSDLQRWLEKRAFVGASVSLVNYVRQMHLAMAPVPTGFSETRPSDGIPDDKGLIAQYLFLYSLSGPDDLSSIVDSAHQSGALRVFVKSDEARFGELLFDDLKTFAEARFRGLPVQPRIGGGALGVQLALNEVVVREKIFNILQVLAVIFLLSSLVQRSLFGGALVLLPLVIAVLLSLGIMGFSEIWLSIATASFTAMSVGIGADFAIYMIFRVREEMREHSNDIDAAVRFAVHTSGRAIFYVSSAVTVGYAVLMLSGFKVWIYLGALTSALIALSAFATLTVLPAALVVLDPKFLHHPPSE